MSSSDPNPGLQISSDAFVVIVERLARIETTLEEIRRDRDEDLRRERDIEGRLRLVEKWKYMLPPTLVTAIISMGVTIYGQSGR